MESDVRRSARLNRVRNFAWLSGVFKEFVPFFNRGRPGRHKAVTTADLKAHGSKGHRHSAGVGQSLELCGDEPELRNSRQLRSTPIIVQRHLACELQLGVTRPSGIVEVDHVLVGRPDRFQSHVAGTPK